MVRRFNSIITNGTRHILNVNTSTRNVEPGRHISSIRLRAEATENIPVLSRFQFHLSAEVFDIHSAVTVIQHPQRIQINHQSLQKSYGGTRRSRVVAVFIRHPVLNHSRSKTENQIYYQIIRHISGVSESAAAAVQLRSVLDTHMCLCTNDILKMGQFSMG
ncbi:hypothetical protein Tco_1248897 [Tanacetum coccineum]